jgi:hypothetical protein
VFGREVALRETAPAACRGCLDAATTTTVSTSASCQRRGPIYHFAAEIFRPAVVVKRNDVRLTQLNLLQFTKVRPILRGIDCPHPAGATRNIQNLRVQKGSSMLSKRLWDPMFSSGRTWVAWERNNTLWLSGVPDRCWSVRGSNLQSKDALRVLYIECVTPEVTADGLELPVAWQRSSGPAQSLVIACHSLGLL